MDFRCRAYLVFILRTLFFVCLGFLQSGDAYEWSALKQAHAAHWRMANTSGGSCCCYCQNIPILNPSSLSPKNMGAALEGLTFFER